jgi:acyl-CoA reductase-like NAD-dependent aldehyde dehydrogenase
LSKLPSTERPKPGNAITGVRLNGNGAAPRERLEVKKTYKLYIGGKFPRSESGRYYKFTSRNGSLIASVCRSSKKDFRDAVVAARKAQEPWADRTAYNKGQILYRVAELLEGRRAQFTETLMLQGIPKTQAAAEVETAIDRMVYYAGWCDKYGQVFSTVNPVESSHFNFSYPEPTGVVAALAPPESGLVGLVSIIAPCILGGNAIVLLADRQFPLTAIELAEVLHASDLPGGVVNLLTGYRDELGESFATHMDVNAVVYCGGLPEELKAIQVKAAGNVKRVISYPPSGWMQEHVQDPWRILDLQEIKTTWHPIGI